MVVVKNADDTEVYEVQGRILLAGLPSSYLALLMIHCISTPPEILASLFYTSVRSLACLHCALGSPVSPRWVVLAIFFLCKVSLTHLQSLQRLTPEGPVAHAWPIISF